MKRVSGWVQSNPTGKTFQFQVRHHNIAIKRATATAMKLGLILAPVSRSGTVVETGLMRFETCLSRAISRETLGQAH
jgi:hypothetical protein